MRIARDRQQLRRSCRREISKNLGGFSAAASIDRSRRWAITKLATDGTTQTCHFETYGSPDSQSATNAPPLFGKPHVKCITSLREMTPTVVLGIGINIRRIARVSSAAAPRASLASSATYIAPFYRSFALTRRIYVAQYC
jgi:hypothetical protein